jgi:hypothetical protein
MIAVRAVAGHKITAAEIAEREVLDAPKIALAQQ